VLQQNNSSACINATRELRDASSHHNSSRESLPKVGSVEIPKLASNIRFIGKMNGVGFRDQQWLVQRDGKFIQMTELLYRIAERANGQHTLEAIAESVSTSTEWLVEAADVSNLIHSKLVPLGLMESQPGETKSEPSPVDVNIRFRTVGARFVEPIASVFQLLCNSVIVSATLVAAGVGHWWFYRIHGVAQGIQEAIYTPGGVLFVIALVLLAAVFHEFGHASALKYHGGKVGSMGMALYIIYPAFYTDVTDNYRLSRWARISTDLGGIYFHLIFTLMLFAAYLTTHRELFLFSVLLVDLEIIQQFIPVIRLDGYWLMADLTGIPDFFSQMAPFLRTLVPSRIRVALQKKMPYAAGLEGTKLPEVKTWVKVVFLSYTLITVPLLAYLVVLMVITLPELITTTWDGLQAQVAMLRAIDVRKDFFTTLLVLLQVGFLVLPVPATIYFLWIMAKSPLNKFINWATRTPRNAFAGVSGIVACCGVAAAFIFVPLSIRRAEPPSDKADRLIQQTEAATKKLSSLTADLEGSVGEDHFTGTIVLQRPNFARVQINGTKGLGTILLIADGKTATTYFADGNQYVRLNAGENGEFIESTLVEQVEQFFRPEAIGGSAHFEYLGHRTSDGNEFDLVEPKHMPVSDETVYYFISRTDKLIYRTMLKNVNGNEPGNWTALKNVRINNRVDLESFTWTLPHTAKSLQMPAGVQLPLK
jgi:outer membrane lipoprotein-sorting protein